MTFWNSRKTEKDLEPTEEQQVEERRFHDRMSETPKIRAGETTQILNLTLERLDREIEEKRANRVSVRKLQESCAQVGARLKKA